MPSIATVDALLPPVTFDNSQSRRSVAFTHSERLSF